ncbi:MAG: undecaprenyl/decaprenyl-phosphate alpha-N-acetylglucosaminyl 1-phosphate transferase [Betaproteobacteria bacterium]|nr:undecaprenyl/decaprenyl-phosphate alpha-N-acetylglucosaminyl 1-phosphate transferase [Betaproteobacteria bacterium]
MLDFVGGQWLAVVLAPLVARSLALGLMRFAVRWNLIDHPGHRKVHDHPTPLVGGLAIFLTLLALQAAAGHVPFQSWSLILALVLVTAIGVADDAHELSHRAKFITQVMGAAVIVSGTSVWVTHMGDLAGLGVVELGKWSMLVTIISFVGVMNAINMIDGLDGLSGCVSLVPILLMAYLAAAGNAPGLLFELLLFAGAILGFLSLNLRLCGRPKALVFMGDTGGMVIGMLLAWYSTKLAGAPGSIIQPITAVWLLAVPLLDMGSVMLLRLHQRKSPFHADQQHMHHLLLMAGYSVNQVVAIMAGFSLFFGVVAIAAEHNGVPEAVMFVTFLGLWGAYVAGLKHPKVMQAMARCIVPPLAGRASSAASAGAAKKD